MSNNNIAQNKFITIKTRRKSATADLFIERGGQSDTDREYSGTELHNDRDTLPAVAAAFFAVLEKEIDRKLICLPEVNIVTRERRCRIKARVQGSNIYSILIHPNIVIDEQRLFN